MPKKINDWTVMFFFAGDNALSPLIVSQLKAVKDAGFQENTEVIVYFDSNERGVPTRVFNVNAQRKREKQFRKTMIGDGRDPLVRSMKEDKVDLAKMQSSSRAVLTARRNGFEIPEATNASDALKNFITFCRQKHRARHYILFLLGHGMIVGNDAFLPDENPVSAITLIEFHKILRGFKRDVKKEGGAFEMLALHSCSMSAVEVAYQLKGTANYMLASEGISYVGSWPYRQLLKKAFNSIDRERKRVEKRALESNGNRAAASDDGIDVQELMESIYDLSLHNGTDYMLSGYNLDLALCNLDPKKVRCLKKPLQDLVAALKEGLEAATLKGDSKDESVKDLILLAHLKSQSYWQEDYTDLYDFCRCLRELCNEKDERQVILSDLCQGVIDELELDRSRIRSKRFDKLVVRSDNFGSKYQYSHGLSIYFPWSEPVDDDSVPTLPLEFQATQRTQKETTNGIMENYKQYAFTKDFGENSWHSFLTKYFEVTKRDSRIEEDLMDGIITKKQAAELRQKDADDGFYNRSGTLSGNPIAALTGGNGKVSPSTGLDCGCPSIKNYPTNKITVKGEELTVKLVHMSEGACEAFPEKQ